MSHRRNGKLNPVDEAKRSMILDALLNANWNIADATAFLRAEHTCWRKVNRSTVWRLAKKFKLMKPGKVMVRRLVKA